MVKQSWEQIKNKNLVIHSWEYSNKEMDIQAPSSPH